ncbi:MAG: ribonuclease P protein component [Bacteroidetes bacterium]|nr:ribonuclease P protein component [Bacteroidota bacterium]
MKNTFQKQERLSGKKTFDVLMKHGEDFYQFPFRVKWMFTDAEMPFPAQVAFAVPKRTFKLAVTRNRIKRILRESYRRNKSFFYEDLKSKNRQIRVMLIFTHKEPLELQESDAKIILTLQRLIKAADAIKGGTKA